MMDWFCGCLPTVKENSVIQAFKPIEGGPLPMGSINTVVIGHNASTNSTKMMAFSETDRIKPIQLPSKSNGYVSVKELKKNAGDRTVFRKIQKSNYETIKESCQKTNSKYTDDAFLPVKPVKGGKNNLIVEWKRLPDIVPNATFMKQLINPNNIMQGQIKDCDFMSSVASLSERDYRIKNLFGQLQLSPYGIYMCRLTYNGIYQEVVVDDYFPVNKEGKLASTQPYMGTDCWMIILEKCWAKLFGSYSYIDLRTFSNYTSESLYALGCAPVRCFQLKDYKKESSTYDQLFRQMKRHEYDVETCYIKYKEIYQKYNFLQVGQVYSVLGVYMTKVNGEPIELVLLRNPLGINGGVYDYKKEKYNTPKLPYGPKDPFWNKVSASEKMCLNYSLMEKEGGGVFYMDFKQFMLAFDEVSICQIDDNSHYLYETASFANYEAKYINLQVHEFTKPFCLLLAQKNKRRIFYDSAINNGNQYASISVLVAKVEKDYQNKDFFIYISSKGYNHIASDIYFPSNYFPVDLGITLSGHYVIRIEVQIQTQEEAIDLTIGYYSPDEFQASFMAKIDDTQFLERVLLDRARKVQPKDKTPLPNASGWRCIENIRGSNLCYIAYRIGPASQHKAYRITFDEVKNKSQLRFLGSRFQQQDQLKPFTVDVPRGNEVIFIYMYLQVVPDPDLIPNVVDDRQLPNPSFDPIP